MTPPIPEWHQLYLEVLVTEPLIPARLVPFFLAVQPSEALQPMIGRLDRRGSDAVPGSASDAGSTFAWPQLASAG